MNCHALLEVRRIVVPLLFCLMVSGPAVAGPAESGDQRSQDGFAVVGVTLGMGIEHVLKIYPAAKIEREAANCYSYGRAISVPELTRRVLRYNDDEGDLTMNFEPPHAGGRLSRIHYDRSVNPATFDIGELIGRLSTRYGAYDRILHRRKMEPAGRIVGFEWRSADGTTLRVVLRNDYRDSGDSLRLSFLARVPVVKPNPTPRLLSLLCGKP